MQQDELYKMADDAAAIKEDWWRVLKIVLENGSLRVGFRVPLNEVSKGLALFCESSPKTKAETIAQRFRGLVPLIHHVAMTNYEDARVVYWLLCIIHRDVMRKQSMLSDSSGPLERVKADLNVIAKSLLVLAARHGNRMCVRELLKHDAMAACLDSEMMNDALIEAAAKGHEGVVRMLLEWPVHAARADCQDGRALIEAAAKGHEGVVRMLLEWPPVHAAARADCQYGLALIEAVKNSHIGVVRTLLERHEHAPIVGIFYALKLATMDGNDCMRVLLHAKLSKLEAVE